MSDFSPASPGFRLDLADGSSWWITGLPPVDSWVEKMAVIMELKPGEPGDSPRLSFVARTDGAGTWPLPRAADGWRRLDQPYLRTWYHPQIPDVICEFAEGTPKGESYLNLWYALLFVQWGSIRRGGLPLHAALVAREGQAVALAGTGDTGKSTCARRLPPPWRPLGDDEVLVVRTPEGRYAAHPFPTWSNYFFESSSNIWKVEQAVPLAGFFFLEQSPADAALPVGRGEAAVRLFNSAAEVSKKFLRYCEDAAEKQLLRKELFANACELAQHLPAFRLQVSLTGRFWDKIEAALGWQ